MTEPGQEYSVPAPPPVGMSLHFDDASPVATCQTALCQQRFHGDSINDAVLAWTAHLTEEHRRDWSELF